MDNTSLFSRRKNKLKAEIQVAESNLVTNLTKIAITDYMPTSTELMPAVKSQLLNNPVQTVDSLHRLSRNLLPEDNDLRKVIKYVYFFAKGYEIITD